MQAPTVSVVVPVRDGAATLPALLASLAEQSLPSEEFEVIVVDNASRDDSAQVARRHGASVAYEPRPNRALARNVGVGQARGKLLAFVDGDCVVEPRWIEELTSCLEHSELVAGRVRIATGRTPGTIERFDAAWRFPQERYVREGFAASANLGVRRQCFEAVGGFDPGYRHIGEDVDFCLRAGERGFRINLCPEAVVSHPAESSLRPVLARGFRHGYSNVQLSRRFSGRFGGPAWRHPRRLTRRYQLLAGLGVDAATLDRAERSPFARLARAEYAARIAGSLWATIRLSR